ncbi:MAG: hypothetical protein AAGA08_11590 [Pseudomonadota bacterium]
MSKRVGKVKAACIAIVFPILAAGAASADVAAAMSRAKSGQFDTSGEVRCAQEVGQALGTCRAEVARAGGAAVVTVSFANGFSRKLSFAERAFLRGNATMSGVGTDTDWSRKDGIFTVRVDDQRFVIDEVLVFGN